MQIGDIIRLIAVFKYIGGDEIMNAFTFRLDSVGSGFISHLGDDLISFATEFFDPWVALCNTVLTSERIEVQEWDSALEQWNTIRTEPWDGVDGEVPNEPYVSQVSPFLVGYTFLPRHRGRKFLPPVDENHMASARLNSNALTAIALMGLDYVTQYTGLNYTMTPGVLSTVDNVFRAFSSGFAFSDNPGTQRRRRTGVGI